MTRRPTPLPVVLVVAALAIRGGMVAAQPADPAEAVRALDRQLQEASVAGDAALLERHLADDFAFTHFGGGRDDRAKWVGMARLNPRPYLQRAVSEQQVELHGDVALVLGRLDVRTAQRQPPGNAGPARSSCYALRYIHAYAWRGERWLFLSHHTTAMIAEARPCD